MRIIKPGVEIMTPTDGILEHLERCGRVCYKSEDKIAEGTAEKFIAGIIKRGHEAVPVCFDDIAAECRGKERNNES
nr:MAG TPA: putative thymidylate synthase [Caudoviricetes sp.]